MNAKMRYEFKPDYAVPPGMTLLEAAESLNMSRTEIADKTGLSLETINQIIEGKRPITFDIAERLESVVNMPAAFWNNLETQYRDQSNKFVE